MKDSLSTKLSLHVSSDHSSRESAVRRSVMARAAKLLKEQQDNVYRHTDRIFIGLLLFQWAAAILISLVISPRTWSGASSQIHIHVWLAIVLGGVLTSFPVLLALLWPGQKITRHVVAVSQMLMSALLIHLTGGRIETHFHVFGSLAFLAFYRDWRVLISASVVVALDHFLRGIYLPQSVYGIVVSEPWRWLEHTGWVVFEDIFLIVAGHQSIREMEKVADRQAQLEVTQDQIEATVRERTAELQHQTDILEQKTRDLTRSNEELEQFAYVASHDLKEPLRNISCFSQLLAGQYRGRLDKQGDEFINYITHGVGRMEVLINDLLIYSQIGKSNIRETMDCEKIFKEVLEDLRMIIEESSAVITHDSLPVLEGDAREWRQLFQNLLGNALKFRGKESPRIHISAVEKTNGTAQNGNGKNARSWIFSVKDNGIGLEPEFAERIFVIFQRLHVQSKYPGTGIGLAICKKIVESRNGHIWVESELGKGATFRFSIPCKEPMEIATNRLNYRNGSRSDQALFRTYDPGI